MIVINSSDCFYFNTWVDADTANVRSPSEADNRDHITTLVCNGK